MLIPEFKYFKNSKKLQDYKYVGNDCSLTYTYVLSPLASYLVQYFPMWITLFGHFMMLGMYMWGVFSCGMDFECRLSDRAMLCCTIFYLSWLILDNIDGKQARRTGSSSPLGLMFDHQVDALNVTITSTYLVNVLMAPQSALIYWFVGAFPFYYTTWEETYTGALNFPYFSAASDGCLAIGLLSFIFYLYSPEFFIYNSILGLEIREFLLLLLIIGVFLITLYNVLTTSNKKIEALSKGFSFFYFVFCYKCLEMFSPSQITIAAGKELMLCFGFCFAREIGYLQISHVSDTEYEPMNWPNFIILSMLIVNTSSFAWGFGLANEYFFLVFMTLLAFFSYAHMVYFCCQEITKELQIPVFTIASNLKLEKKDKEKDST